MSFHLLRRPKRVLAVAASLGLLAAGLTGCSTSSGTSGSATSGNITWWGWTPDQVVAENAIKEFNKQYPKIHITYKKIQDATYAAALRPALASSSGPDVFNLLVG